MNVGIQFEEECIKRLKILGFTNVSGTPINDYGADIVAFYKDDKYIFQCKCHQKKQGVSAVQEIMGAKLYYDAQQCAVISHSGFTKQAYNLATPNSIILLDSHKVFSSQNIAELLEGISKMDYVECENLSLGKKKILTTNQIEYKFETYSNFIERINNNKNFLELKKQLREIFKSMLLKLDNYAKEFWIKELALSYASADCGGV